MYPLFLAALPVLPSLAHAQEPDPGAAPPRLLVNAAVVGAGLGLGTVAAYNYTQAREAYRDYLDEPDTDRAERLLANQVRPRQIAVITEGAASLAAIGAGVALWATTNRLDAPADAREGLGRKLGGTAALGVGATSATLAVYNYAQAREAYRDYLDEPDDDDAKILMEDQIRPRQLAAGVQAGIALLGLGAGATLWVGGERVSVGAGPNQVAVEARW